MKHQNAAQVRYLVQKEGFSETGATWEAAEHFEQIFPEFDVNDF